MLPDSKIILEALHECTNEEALKEFFASYLGKKWSVNALFKQMKDLSPEERKTQGQLITWLYTEIEQAFFAKQDSIKQAYRNEKLEKEIVDISTPWNKIPRGFWNLQNKLRRKIENIFQWMGYHIEYGHDVVSVEENFESVNIPASHPATEMHDTLYVKNPDESGERLLLRTHTSAHQVELIKKYGPACKFIIPGKVYRNENMDASHDVAFWQVEWVVIDKWINMGHFKHTMEQVLKAILETDTIELRMRPAYFPFVEPGVEIDARAQSGGKEKWLEILGAWMIHPQVLKNAGLDPKEYSWFAFGLGMTRLVAVRYGLNDVRLLTNGDLRFLHSFK